ncbi:MAG TPA: hypothetical protein VFB32_09675 [Rudaea sp.]|nr:hypothetical protein [Rudaea sp.]
MARPADPQIRNDLRERAIDYALAHGISDLSLRPLADALDTSARMLVYHFGSREGLMREILSGLRERQDAYIRAWLDAGDTPRSLEDFLRWYWRLLSSEEARPVVRMIFELYALALRRPAEYPGVLGDPLVYWRGLLARLGVPEEIEDAEATLMLAATRGLLLDVCTSGDQTRTTAALELLARSIGRGKGAGPRTPRKPGKRFQR